MLEVGLDDLKRASATAGGSVNDGFMAAVTAGLRRYHEHHGQPVDELRVTLPISVRTPEDPAAGNRITLARFTVPVDSSTRRLESGPSGNGAGRRVTSDRSPTPTPSPGCSTCFLPVRSGAC